MTKLNRRLFIAGGLAAGGAVVAPTLMGAAPRAAGFPFGLGVASGDPRPDGVVLWTRLAAKPLDIGGGMSGNIPVEWEVATDEAFANVIATGTETAIPAEGHSVHAEPRGLPAGAELFYRFRANGFISPVGRTRTAPAAGTAPASVKFAMASCQHFEEGWYHAHRFIAADEPDLVLFLGDYMYEKQSGLGAQVRGYVDFDEVDVLDEYRLRYAQTKLDPGLKAAHAVGRGWWCSTTTSWPTGVLGEHAAAEGHEAGQLGDPAVPAGAVGHAGALPHDGHAAVPLAAGTQQQLHGDPPHRPDADRCGTGAVAARRARGGWFAASRTRITQGWVNRQVRNPVVLTGDVHRHWANDVKLNYFDDAAPAVGTELVTTSVTSGGNPGSTDPTPGEVAQNPHLNYVGNRRGYVRVTASAAQLTAEFMRVSSVTEPDPAKVTAAVHRRFVVADGVPGLQDA